MNLLALALGIGNPAGLIVSLAIVGLVIYLIFYVLPLPPPVRTILAVLVALALVLWLFAGCSSSGEGGSWTPADTSAAIGAVNQGFSTYDRISHPEYYRPAYTVPGAVIVP